MYAYCFDFYTLCELVRPCTFIRFWLWIWTFQFWNSLSTNDSNSAYWYLQILPPSTHIRPYAFIDMRILPHCTEVCFASFFSGGFITAIVVNPPERKLAKHTSVHCKFIRSCTSIGNTRVAQLSLIAASVGYVVLPSQHSFRDQLLHTCGFWRVQSSSVARKWHPF